MALQTFTAGQVLTAAQVTALQTNGFNQTVSTKTADHTLVAADKGTRVEMNSASATTITVDTDLFNAGDTLFIQNRGAGVCTITAGTATVSTSGDLALVENAGGTLFFVSAGVAIFYATGVTAAAAPSGLTLINTTTFSAVASQSVNDVFTSTFANYRVLLDVVGSTDMDINCRLRTSGADNSSATYNTRRVALQATYGSGSSTTATLFHFAVGRATNKSAASFDFFKPQSATQTNALGQSYEPATLLDLNGLVFTNNTQFDGFTLLPSTGTITGEIRVYGYAN